MDDTTKHSKLLSLVLRHRPETIGITLDAAGWVEVDDLLSRLPQAGVSMTRAQLEHIVNTNDKKRFVLSEGGDRIRANQGHSLPVDLGLKPRQPPDLLFHGTARKSLASIMREGLKRGRRQHVHLHTDRRLAEIVGRRHGDPVLLQITAGRMWSDGHVFFRSENSVWLTEAVPIRYLDEFAEQT